MFPVCRVPNTTLSGCVLPGWEDRLGIALKSFVCFQCLWLCTGSEVYLHAICPVGREEQRGGCSAEDVVWAQVLTLKSLSSFPSPCAVGLLSEIP